MGEQAQVDKRCYKNQTAGWLGVVKLDHLGAQRGHSIKPHGTVWLSDDEATLTARAPADPAKNPFVEQTFDFYDEENKIVQAPMRPLVLVEDDREIPSEDRYVPTAPATEEGQQAAAREAQEALAAASPRPVASEATADPQRPAVTAVPAEHATPESWTDVTDRTEAPQAGSLAGSDDPAAAAPEGEVAGPTGAPPQQPVPTSVASGEEHAAFTESGEETGAAETPVGEPPEGEYASHEEVGSPDAPTQGGS